MTFTAYEIQKLIDVQMCIRDRFNALGDSRTPLFFLIFSSLFNVALDVWFVAGFQMGVAGVAWATFIAQRCV